MTDLRLAFRRLDRADIENAARKSLDYRYLGKYVAITRVLGSFNLFVDTRDTRIVPHLIMDGFWEMWITQAIVSRVQPGWRCMVSDSSYGYYPVLLSKLGVAEVHSLDWSELGQTLTARSAQINGCNIKTPDLFSELTGPYDFVKISGNSYSHAYNVAQRFIGSSAQVLLELRDSEYSTDELRGVVTELQESYSIERVDADAQLRPVEVSSIEGSVWLWLTPR